MIFEDFSERSLYRQGDSYGSDQYEHFGTQYEHDPKHSNHPESDFCTRSADYPYNSGHHQSPQPRSPLKHDRSTRGTELRLSQLQSYSRPLDQDPSYLDFPRSRSSHTTFLQDNPRMMAMEEYDDLGNVKSTLFCYQDNYGNFFAGSQAPEFNNSSYFPYIVPKAEEMDLSSEDPPTGTHWGDFGAQPLDGTGTQYSVSQHTGYGFERSQNDNYVPDIAQWDDYATGKDGWQDYSNGLHTSDFLYTQQSGGNQWAIDHQEEDGMQFFDFDRMLGSDA